MKLKKEQQLIQDFTCLKYNEFSLENLEKGSKIMYSMQKYNVMSSFSMWKDLIELYILNVKLESLTVEFELFVINSFISFFNITDLDFLFKMILSLELSSQFVVTYIFISPEFDLNFISAIIYKLAKQRNFKIEIEIIKCIQCYSKRLNKNIFDFNVFLEEVCLIHLKNKSFNQLDEEEEAILDFIIKLHNGNKKRLSKIICAHEIY